MKLGLLISAALVIALAAVFFAATRTAPPDPATPITAPERLAAVTLPDDLPWPRGLPRNSELYGPIYDRALTLYQQRRSAYELDGPPQGVVDELVTLLIEAASAGGASPGFLDKHVPMRVGAEPGFGDALEGIVSIALREAQRRWVAGDRAAAMDLAVAVWALGDHAFRDNVRLYPRLQGVQMITRTGMMLYGWRPPTVPERTLRAWGAAVQAIDENWTPKLEVVRGVQPPIGDLIAIARADGDRTFRIEAMLQLGVAQHVPRGEGNRKAIRAAIEAGKADPDPLVAEAAEEADAFTVEQVRRLR